ncbi:hypothetical protein DEO72_LG3g2230 [Vigna unguiculata]|uniref:Uncharacterized protein n=1 Tax=Vigna unguiculata TaxID=3917 RepID=A0A4D6LGQ0_VIGUN|nr:hypothetical protein DEO72_LG3g2230 [Vigna unguiculata]
MEVRRLKIGVRGGETFSLCVDLLHVQRTQHAWAFTFFTKGFLLHMLGPTTPPSIHDHTFLSQPRTLSPVTVHPNTISTALIQPAASGSLSVLPSPSRESPTPLVRTGVRDFTSSPTRETMRVVATTDNVGQPRAAAQITAIKTITAASLA